MPIVGMRLRALQSLVPAVPLIGPSSLRRALSAPVVAAVVPVVPTLVVATPVVAPVVPVVPTLVVAAVVVATVVPVAPTLVVATLVVPVHTMTVPVRAVVAPAGVAVMRVVMTALARQPRRVARREGATRNSRLAADIPGKCDVLARALGSQDLHAMAFPAVIVRERVRDPVRHAVCRDVALARIFVLMRMRMPPKHELLDDEEHAEPDHQRSANAVRPARPHALHRFGQ
jgi:hypothetical protein